MLAPNKHDNRKLDHPVGLAIPVLLSALCAPALAAPRGGGEGYDPRYVDMAWRADLSGNGTVDFADIQLFMEAWQSGAPGADPGQADIDMDGRITFTDLNILLAVFGMQVSPPQGMGGPLVPGEGFSAPTPQPAAVGSAGSPGYDAKSIARWDVTPYQEVSGEFEIGVVAFHRKGINRVEFSLEGGPWLPVTEMTENERTGVWEYWTTVNANELPDGPIEIRAVAFPNVGEPRVLEPLFLNANAHGTWGRGEVWVSSMTGSDSSGNGTEASPFKTIWKAMQSFGSGANIDGLRVNLMEGSHVFSGSTNPYPVTADGWVTITSAPGADPQNVRLVGDATPTNSRMRVGRIHLQNLTLDQRSGWPLGSFNTLNPMLWLDGVNAIGQGQFTNTKPFHYANWTAAYVTDCQISEYKDGCLGAKIARNVEMLRIGSDAFTNSSLVINSSVRDMPGSPELGWHPDVYQFFGVAGEARENVIVYGLRAYDVWGQGIFAKDLASLKDIAFVNVLVERIVTEQYGPNDPTYSQWLVEPTDHLLLWHVTLVNQEFRWAKDGVKNVSVLGSCFEAFRGVGEMLSLNGSTAGFEAMGDWRSNHYTLGSGYGVLTPGVDVTSGNPMFENMAEDNFRPSAYSPLRARLPLVCRPAADGADRNEVTSVGAFER